MPEYHVSSASAAGTLLQLAIKKSDSVETDKIRGNLAGLDVELATWQAIDFNEKGQSVKWSHPVIQVQGGKYILVYPESSQEGAPIYPVPEWKKR